MIRYLVPRFLRKSDSWPLQVFHNLRAKDS